MGPFRSSRFLTALAVSIGITASAQVLSGPHYEAVLNKAFDTDSSATKLVCEATPIRPQLDFSLRFQTGFLMDLPLSQFDGPRHHGILIVRVTPEDRRPSYIASRVNLPDTARTKLSSHIQGSFAVGEGKYKVDLFFADDLDRVCRSQWQIEAKLDGTNRHLNAAVPPLTVAGASTASEPAPPLANQGRLTVLMHVAPASPQLAKLPESDAMKLLGSLSALLAQLHPQLTRLVLFDLQRQKVLFRKEDFAAANLPDVARLLDIAQFSTVDYATLQNPKGPVDFLTQLTEEERCELGASDALVFLGLHTEVHGSIRSSMVKKIRGGPRVFYLECASPLSLLAGSRDSGVGISAAVATIPTPEYADTDDGDRSSLRDGGNDDDSNFSPQDQPDNVPDLSPGDRPDIVEQLVSRLKGETIQIRLPNDCARAIRRIAAHASGTKNGVESASTAH